MYNEDIELFVKTMTAVQKNIDYLCVNERWGKEGWKNFVVVIVSDGAKLINPRVKLGLEVMGLFDESLVMGSRDGFPVAAHLFQRSTNIAINSSLEVDYKATPMQTIFLLKQENAKKINSHRWYPLYNNLLGSFLQFVKNLNQRCVFYLTLAQSQQLHRFIISMNAFKNFRIVEDVLGKFMLTLVRNF
jgi:Chitin synthase